MFPIRIILDAAQLVLHKFIFLFQVKRLLVQLEDLVGQFANVLLVVDDLLAQLMVFRAQFEHLLVAALVLLEQFGVVFGFDFARLFVVEGFLCVVIDSGRMRCVLQNDIHPYGYFAIFALIPMVKSNTLFFINVNRQFDGSLETNLNTNISRQHIVDGLGSVLRPKFQGSLKLKIIGCAHSEYGHKLPIAFHLIMLVTI